MSFSIKDIAKTLKDSKKQGTPIIVFTGAGCSKSAGMPLASELITEINKKFKGNLKSLTDEQKKDYGVCMSRLTPHEQKTLIEKHISKAKINWANIALASLLKHGYLGKVLTFNFDNILNRACSLDNFFPPIYDLKVLSEEYFTAIPHQAIVHLHGQWSGFQLANSGEDTKAQANKLKNYIKNTINTSPTLFIGYSGGADAFFKLVEENFIGQHRLFWVDYAKEPNNNVQKFIDANPNHRNFIAEQDADKFLLELAIELKCFPTELFKDPIKHLKVICEYVNNFPLNTFESDIDVLEDTKKTLAIADANKPIITTIKLGELLHAKKFESILNQVKNLDLKIKPISKIVASAYLGKALIFLTKDESQFQINFDKAISLKPDFYQAYADVGTKLISSNRIDALIKSKDFFENCFTINPKIKDDTIIGHYAIALSKLARIKEDKSLFEKAFVQYENALKIQPEHANHLGNYGNALLGLGRIKQDESLFEKAFVQYENALKIQPEHANHLGNYGNALLGLGRIKQDESLFEKAFIQYENALKIQPEHADHLGNYGSALSELAKIKQDESLFEKAFVQYENALKIQPEHANHLGNYGNALSELAKIKQDESLFEKAFVQYENALKIQPEHANNLGNYGNALLGLGRIKQDESMFEKAFIQYENALKIQPEHANHLGNYGNALSDLAKIKQDESMFEKAFVQYENALKIQPEHANNLGNYGNALLGLGRIKQDESLFEKAFIQYENALKIQPEHANHLGNYGNALSDLAKIKQDESLFEKAFVQYEKALKIQPEHANHLGNYGSALSELATIKQDESLLEKAFVQYENALIIQPEHANNLGNYGSALSELAKIKQDESMFEKAFVQYESALKIQPNKTYNLACYYALIRDSEKSRINLLHAEKHDTLPKNSLKYLKEDIDLDNVRNEQWFTELLERLKAKEEAGKVA